MTVNRADVGPNLQPKGRKRNEYSHLPAANGTHHFTFIVSGIQRVQSIKIYLIDFRLFWMSTIHLAFAGPLFSCAKPVVATTHHWRRRPTVCPCACPQHMWVSISDSFNIILSRPFIHSSSSGRPASAAWSLTHGMASSSAYKWKILLAPASTSTTITIFRPFISFVWWPGSSSDSGSGNGNGGGSESQQHRPPLQQQQQQQWNPFIWCMVHVIVKWYDKGIKLSKNFSKR